MTCVRCNKDITGRHFLAQYCWECFLAKNVTQNSAKSRVQQAIKKGGIQKLDGSVLCRDCGDVATVYDHRDYAKPLEVDPVCRACNRNRGPVIWLEIKNPANCQGLTGEGRAGIFTVRKKDEEIIPRLHCKLQPHIDTF